MLITKLFKHKHVRVRKNCSQTKLDIVQPCVVYCNVCKSVDEMHFVRHLIRGLVYQD